MIKNKRSSEKISRRTTLAALAGSAAFFIPAWNETVEAADTLTCVSTTPTVTEGPYWVDEKLFRSDIRTDPSTGVARAGVPLALTINVQNLTFAGCSALVGAYVDIWHCDAKGIYSDEPSYNPGGGTGTVVTSGQKFLRGYQITDQNGSVTFTTVYPGWYSSRTIHIHVRVRTYNGSTVLSNFVSQIFFDETINNTALAAPAYTRTSARDTTNARDMVYNVANQTRMLSTTTGSNDAGYVSTITMGAQFQVPAATAPTIASGGVGNAVSGIAGATPGSWISIYGTGLAATTRVLASSDLVSDVIPTTLGGVSVQINNKPAFVQYVSPTQINVLAPADASRGSVSVSVNNGSVTSNSVSTTMLSVLPGLSTLSGYVRAVRSDGAIINGTGNVETGYKTSAAVGPGDTLSLYGTGFGATSASLADGLVFTGAYPTANAVTVTIGNTPASVAFAGLVGPGLYQINVVVPPSLADGDYALVASVAGSSSQANAMLKVAASAKLTGVNAALQMVFGRGRVHPVSSIEHVAFLGALLQPRHHPVPNDCEGEQEGCLVKLA
ncbi:MAG: IPT/TIG domain-containing protein [Candidatus Solibacter sp.]